jgi:FkbM family methyltransferase
MQVCKYYLETFAPGKGYYVELGAFNGKTQNSTIVLEKAGWNGVCVEALPVNFQKLKKNRHCKCIQGAIYNKLGTITFVDVGTPGWSGIKDTHQDKHKERYSNDHYKEIEVPCYTFDQIVDQTDINYLQIDVEGAELVVLNSIDWSLYNISYICIEDNLKVEQNDNTYYNKLTSLGYELVYQNHKDFLYVKTN